MPVNAIDLPPVTQVMNKDKVVDKIMQHETEVNGKCNNVCNIITAAVCGMIGCPLCCWFCCGCCGKCAPTAMVPRDEGIKGLVEKLSPDERTVLNCEGHVLAMALGCSPTSWCTACMCCGVCGKCGPFATGKLVAMVNEANARK